MIRNSNVFIFSALIVFSVASVCIVTFLPLKFSLLLIAGAVLIVLTFIKIEFAVILLIFAMLLSPEISFGQVSTGGTLESGRTLIIRIEDILLLILGFAWLAKIAIQKDLGIIKRTKMNKAIAIYLFTIFFSSLWGWYNGNVRIIVALFYILKYFEYFFLYFIISNHIDTSRQLKLLIKSALIVCLIVSLFAMYQIPSGNRISAPFEGEKGEPNTLGGYLVFMICIILGIYLFQKNKSRKIILGILGILTFIPFLYTLSRGSWLALIPAVIILAIITKKRFAIFTITTGIILIILLLSPHIIFDRITYTFQQPYERGQILIGNIRLDTSTSDRLYSWKDAVIAWAEKPLFGYGVTGWKFIDSQYFRTLVETGLLGITALFYLIFSIYRESYYIFKKIPEKMELYKGISAGYLAGLAALMVHSIAANTFIIIRIMEPFWLFTGLVIVTGTKLLNHENVKQSRND